MHAFHAIPKGVCVCVKASPPPALSQAMHVLWCLDVSVEQKGRERERVITGMKEREWGDKLEKNVSS